MIENQQKAIESNPQDQHWEPHQSCVEFLETIGIDSKRTLAIVAGKDRLYQGTIEGIQECRKTEETWHPQGQPIPLQSLDKQQKEGVFFRPCNVGHTNDTWEGSNILFWECDNCSLEEQEQRAQDLVNRGLGYHAKVFSGSKSLHYYIRIQPIVDPELWLRLMQKIAILMDSDCSIPMLNRLMRLPGFHRLKDGEWQEQKVLELCPDEDVYDAETIEQILDSTDRFPMGLCERRWRDWKSVTNKLKQGEKVDREAVLSLDYVEIDRQARIEREKRKAQRSLRPHGGKDLQELIGEAEDILGLDPFLDHLSEHKPNRAGKIRCLPVFRTGQGSTSAFVAPYRGHARTIPEGRYVYVDPQDSNKAMSGFNFWLAVHHGENYKPAGKEFVDRVRSFCAIAGLEVPPSKPFDHSQLSTVKQPDHVEVDSETLCAVDVRAKVSNCQEEEGLLTEQEFLDFAELSSDRLNSIELNQILPSRLCQAVHEAATVTCTDPFLHAFSLLPCICSLMGHASIDTGFGFGVPNIVYTLGVLPSGGGKSRVKAIYVNILNQWQGELKKSYDEEKESYDRSVNAKDSHAEQKSPPILRKMIFTHATPEGILRRLAEQDSLDDRNGSLWCVDEGQRLISLGQYQGKNGDATSVLLELWDASGIEYDRTSKSDSFHIAETRLSIMANIQDDLLRNVFTLSDQQGFLARFIPYKAQPIPYKLSQVKNMAVHQLIPQLYNDVRHQHWGEMRLSPDAESYFKELAEYYGNYHSPVKAVEYWAKKAPGHVIRIAHALHAIRIVCHEQGERKDLVSLKTLRAAADLLGIAFHSVKKICGLYMDEGLVGLTDQILKFFEHGAILAARDIQRKGCVVTYCKKYHEKPVALTLSLLNDLVSKGYLSTKTEGRVTKFYRE